MHLLPLLAAALAAGLAARLPLVALALLAPTFLVPRLRALRAHALAFGLGTLLPLGPPAAGDLVAALPEGAPLVRIEGTVRTGPDRPAFGRIAFDLDVAAVGGRPLPGRVRVLCPAGGLLPSPGARIAAIGRLKRPRPAGNPGERGPREALAARGITHLMVLGTAEALTVAQPAPAFSLRALVHRSRIALDGALAARVRPPGRDLLGCILLGRRDRLAESVADDFRRSGTSHFLAISGLHVGLLAGLVWLALRPLPLPRPAASVLVTLAALFYAALTGLRPPALRAALFVALACGGALLRRPVRIANVLALAAFLILVLDPGSLARAGFQLSFAAVLAIVHLTPPISEGLFGRMKLVDLFSVPRSRPWPVRVLRAYVMGAVPVSLAAWLGTAPIALTRFGTVSALTLPANLLVFPLVAALIPTGLLAALTGLSLPAEILSRALLALVGSLASLPGAAVTVPAPPLLLVLAFYAGLVLLGLSPAVGARRLIATVLGLAALAAAGPLCRRAPERPRLTVLSVGHGLCAVLETTRNGVLVYDAGSTRPAIFRRVVLPWLRERGISAVDVLIVSHGDADHVSAVPPLLANLPVGILVRPGERTAGEDLAMPGATIEVLHPPSRHALGGNDASTVVRVRAGGFVVLLPGDIEEAGIATLLAARRPPRAEVLLLPHHGRPTPGAGSLRAAVAARVLVSSDGPGDPFDPAWAGALRTSERGAITVDAAGRVRTFR